MNPGTQVQTLDEFWQVHTLYQVFVGSAFVTMVINVTWFVISWMLKHLVRIANRRIRSHDFILGRAITRAEYRKFAEHIRGFRCLLVRHGTDDYLSKMASDQERFEGRQQLKVLPIKVHFDWSRMKYAPLWKRIVWRLGWRAGDDAKAIFKLTLPIHRRLGTQFKCFIVARDAEPTTVDAIISTLNVCEHVSDARQSDSYHKDRIYFLLDQFFKVDTITEGISNNYIFPE